MEKSVRPKVRKMIWGSVVATVLLFYFLFDPMQYEWMPQCVFHKLTGMQCMGCGSQRMAHALLHGDFKGAFESNAFVFCCLPAIVALIFIEINRTRYPALYKRVHSRGVIITAAALLLLWLPLRNMIGI